MRECRRAKCKHGADTTVAVIAISNFAWKWVHLTSRIELPSLAAACSQFPNSMSEFTVAHDSTTVPCTPPFHASSTGEALCMSD